MKDYLQLAKGFHRDQMIADIYPTDKLKIIKQIGRGPSFPRDTFAREQKALVAIKASAKSQILQSLKKVNDRVLFAVLCVLF